MPRGQNGHGRQHRSRMPRALPNPPDDVARIRKRQLRQGQSDARIYVDPANGARRGKNDFAISRLILTSAWVAFAAGSCRWP